MLLVTSVLACHSSAAVPADGAGDAAAEDGHRDPPLDALAPDALTLDAPAVDCAHPGAPQIISTVTPSAVSGLQIATIGTRTMTIWTHGSYPTSRLSWALFEGGAVVKSGDIAATTDLSPHLAVASARFIVGYASRVVSFDGTAWQVAQGTVHDSTYVQSGAIVGVFGGGGALATEVSLTDGDTVSAPVTIASHPLGVVAGDGAGGFGVVTLDNTTPSARALRFLSYDGVGWTAESVPFATAGINITDLQLARTPTTWVVSYVAGTTAYVWQLANGTWTNLKTRSGTTPVRFSVAANGESLAVASDAGYVAIYRSSAWTESQLVPATYPGHVAPQLRATASGFVVSSIWAATSLVIASYDGAAWSTRTLASNALSPNASLLVRGDDLAIGYRDYDHSSTPATYAEYIIQRTAGTWSAPAELVVDPDTLSGQVPWLFHDGAAVRAVYSVPGQVETAAVGVTVGSPTVLPMSVVSGPARSTAHARTASGHLLVAWQQDDARGVSIFAAEYDGAQWSAAIKLGHDDINAIDGPRIAAAGESFAVAWRQSGGQRRVIRWSTTPGAPVNLGAFSTGAATRPLLLGSDGTRFIAAWSDLPSFDNITSYATSIDGTTWSTATTPDGPTYIATSLTSGPLGAVLQTTTSAGSSHVSLWSAGATSWSATQNLSDAYTCATAVGPSSLLIACTSVGLHTLAYDSTGWMTTDIATPMQAPANVSVALDGDEARIDYAATDGRVSSVVRHAGTWGAPVAATDAHVAKLRSTLAACGRWTAVYGDFDLFLTSTMGGDGYPLGTAAPFSSATYPALSTTGTAITATWTAPASGLASDPAAVWADLAL